MNINQLEVISEVKCSELGAQNLKSGTESASKYNSSMAPMGTESSKMFQLDKFLLLEDIPQLSIPTPEALGSERIDYGFVRTE